MSEATSLVQTQELIMSIFSCVGYLRDLFPEESFQDHNIAGMNLKRFRKGGDKNSDELLKWIEEGCFDALQKKYLKSAVLTVLADTTSPNNVLETYTLRVTYPDSRLHQAIDATTANIAQLSLTRNDKSVLAVESSPNNFKEAVSKILRSLCVMSQTLKSLPAKKCLSMKLSYYEEVTPQGYEPPGFIAAEFDIDHLFQGPTSKFAFGKAATPFHNIGLSMETMCDDSIRPCKATASTINSQVLVFPESTSTVKLKEPVPEPLEPSMSPTEHQHNTMNIEEGINFNESIMIASQVAQAANSPPKFPQSQPAIQSTIEAAMPNPTSTIGINKSSPSVPTNMTDLSDTQQQLQRIKCTCGHNVKDLEMIKCNICMAWQHSVCAGYVSCRDRRLESGAYSCYYCQFGTQIQTFQFICNLSLMRKALAILSSEGFTNVKEFSERMSVSNYKASKLRDRLLEEKFLLTIGPHKLKFEIAKKDEHIKERIKFYFNQNLEIHSEFLEAQKRDHKKKEDAIKSNTKSDSKKDVPIEISPNTLDVKPCAPVTPIAPKATVNPVTPVSAKSNTINSNSVSNKKRKISVPSSRISCYLNEG